LRGNPAGVAETPEWEERGNCPVPDASKDDRPPMVVASHWVQQITSIALEMVLPACVGVWLDRRWGTEPWLVVAGGILGFAFSMWHLLTLAKKQSRGKSSMTKSIGDGRRD
jgi:F0F1-type ATP synthase assembly protein I